MAPHSPSSDDQNGNSSRLWSKGRNNLDDLLPGSRQSHHNTSPLQTLQRTTGNGLWDPSRKETHTLASPSKSSIGHQDTDWLPKPLPRPQQQRARTTQSPVPEARLDFPDHVEVASNASISAADLVTLTAREPDPYSNPIFPRAEIHSACDSPTPDTLDARSSILLQSNAQWAVSRHLADLLKASTAHIDDEYEKYLALTEWVEKYQRERLTRTEDS